jgi:predicted RNase H-like HicB family nuclease
VLKVRRLIMKYKIVLNKTDEGYSVSCPGLPGCWSQGKTEAEAIDNIKDAIQEYLAAVYASVKESNVREVEIAI